MRTFDFRLMLTSIAAASVVVLGAATASAQTPPPPSPGTPPPPVAVVPLSTEDKLVKATEAAEDAAKAARDAALATEKLAEAFGLELKPAVPPGPPPGPPPPPKNPWAIVVGLNLISDTGNATAFAGKITAKATGTWGKWSLTLAGDGAYGQSEAFHMHMFTTTALNADLLARVERNFTDNFGIYALGGTTTDHVASIAYTAFGEAGISVIWYQRKEADYVKARVRTDFGFRYTHELDYQFFATPTTPVGDLGHPRDIWAARAAVSLLYAITKTAVFSEDAEVLYDVLTPQDVRASSLTAITAEVVKGFSLSLSFKIRYIGVPAPGALPTDTELAAGIAVAF